MKTGKAPILSAQDQRASVESSKFAISKDVKSTLTANRGNLWLLLMSILFVLVQSAVIGMYFAKLPPQIPLFYSRTWGDPMLGSHFLIWIFPVIAFSFILLNLLLYLLFFKNNNFLARVLFVSNLVIGFTTFWGSMKIVTLLA